MAMTNFGLLTDEQKTIWSMDLWKAARNYSFVNKFTGNGANSMIQKVDELKKTEKGARAVITLLHDLEGDGIAGDRTLEGNEEAMRTGEQVIRIDQLRHASRHEGRMADQKSIVEFRNNAKDALAYWLAERVDQMAFLALSGVPFTKKNDGTDRVGSDLPYLEFASDVTAPTSKRVFQWDATNGLVANGAMSNIIAADTPTWNMFIELKAYAKTNYIRGIKENGGEETYHVFLTPQAMAKLKKDADYVANLRNAQVRADGNPLFTGATVKIDGLYIHEYRNVYHGALGAANAQACQMLFCGAQALGMADLGNPTWVEEEFDYGNQQGISVQKMLGFLKPKFYSQAQGTTEDFGVVSVYVAQ
jgi:N4-gp56 family major capsid protein